MLLVQIRLAPLYRQVPFGPGTWAFAFSYLQALTVGLHWLDAERVPGRSALTWLFIAAATVGVLLLVLRTGVGLLRGTFLPRAPELVETEVGPRSAVPAGS